MLKMYIFAKKGKNIYLNDDKTISQYSNCD